MRFLYTLLFLLASLSLAGQTLKALEKKGDEAVGVADYYTAMVHYAEALTIEPENIRLQFKYAEVCLEFRAYEEALERLLTLDEQGAGKELQLLPLRLGQCYRSLGDYSTAAGYLQQFLGYYQGGADDPLGAQATMELNACKWAMEQSPTSTSQTVITHLERGINTTYSEFAPLPLGDTLYYSSHRYEWKDDKRDPPRRLSKVLRSDGGAKGRPLRRGFNVKDRITAHTCFNHDRSRIYFTLCDYVEESTEIRCKIYYREKDRRGNWESRAKALPPEINRAGSTTTQPHLYWDSIRQQEVLLFVSDHPQGTGGLDIWLSVLEEENFAEPIPLETINTPWDDVTPFVDPATQDPVFQFSRASRLWRL